MSSESVRSPYLTVQETAMFARVDQKTVRRAIADGRLRAMKPVRKILIRQDDVVAWIEGSEVIPQPALPERRRGDHSRPGRDDGPASVARLRAMDDAA